MLAIIERNRTILAIFAGPQLKRRPSRSIVGSREKEHAAICRCDHRGDFGALLVGYLYRSTQDREPGLIDDMHNVPSADIDVMDIESPILGLYAILQVIVPVCVIVDASCTQRTHLIAPALDSRLTEGHP